MSDVCPCWWLFERISWFWPSWAKQPFSLRLNGAFLLFSSLSALSETCKWSFFFFLVMGIRFFITQILAPFFFFSSWLKASVLKGQPTKGTYKRVTAFGFNQRLCHTADVFLFCSQCLFFLFERCRCCRHVQGSGGGRSLLRSLPLLSRSVFALTWWSA